MSGVIIIDDDLEEGEIADDAAPEPTSYSKVKDRKLPRRYTLHDNNKNKKMCKHGHHHRKKSKTNGSPFLHKKHHKSCPHHSSDRRKLKTEQFYHPKSNHLLESRQRDNHSTFGSSIFMKSAFRNFTSPPRTVTAVSKPDDLNTRVVKDIDSFSKKVEDGVKSDAKTLDSSNLKNESSQKSEYESSEGKQNKLLPNPSDNASVKEATENEVNGEGSEDEEELRRIALSTCLKRPSVEENPENEIWTNPSNLNGDVNISTAALPDPITKNISSDYDVQCRDNYDIVDMEVDDNESSKGDAHEELFVIDTVPVTSSEPFNLPNGEFGWNSNNFLSDETFDYQLEKGQYLPSDTRFSNEDFEEELLRAEIIAGMDSFQQKQHSSKKQVSLPEAEISSPKDIEILPKVQNNLPEKQTNVLKNKNQSKVQPSLLKKRQSFKKTVKSLPIYSKRPVSNFTNASRKKINKTKLNYTKLTNNKKVTIPPQRKINSGQERIVITLNNDSSSEESDQELDVRNDIRGNAVASIEALISDARQKSDIPKVVENNLNSVSCLSKAQQEEYNSLKKILAEKQILPVQSLPPKVAKTINPPDLCILDRKISIAKENLKKEIKLKNDAETEHSTKKQMYITSKLKVQHLKEQVHAAELNRITNLQLWKKSAAKLDILKRAVLKQEAVLNLLEKRLNSKRMLLEQKLILSSISRNDAELPHNLL